MINENPTGTIRKIESKGPAIISIKFQDGRVDEIQTGNFGLFYQQKDEKDENSEILAAYIGADAAYVFSMNEHVPKLLENISVKMAAREFLGAVRAAFEPCDCDDCVAARNENNEQIH